MPDPGANALLDLPSDLPTLPEVLAASAAADPDAPALLAADGTAVTRGALLAATLALRTQLRRLGVGPEDRVVVVLPNGPGPTVLALGLLAATVTVPLHPSTTEDEVAALLPRLRPAALLDLGGHDGAAAAVRAGVPVLRAEIRLGTRPEVRIAGDPVAPPVEDCPPGLDDLALILSTSGSTGRPKLVPRTHRSITIPTLAHARALGVGPSDRSILLGPIAHALGLMVLWRAIFTGAPLLCPALPDSAVAADLAARFDPTWLVVAPALLAGFLDLASARDDLPNPSLRFVRCASAELTDALRARAEAILGVPVLNTLGSSEAPNIALEGVAHPPRPGTVGWAFPGVRIAADDDTPLQDGEAGEIQVSSPDVFPGYWDDPDLTARAFTPDGWFRTGDRGILRDGYLTLLGRADETINRGGQKVGPLEVEDALAAHPAVAEAAVFGIPHPRLGQEVAVAIVLRPGASLTGREARRFLLERLSPHKAPRVVRFVDALPRTANGKVLRRELADMVYPPLSD